MPISEPKLLPSDKQCAALDNDAQRCRRKPVRVTRYHGDPEVYGMFHEPWPSWVRIALCDKHSEASR